jgi:hypothetical protein
VQVLRVFCRAFGTDSSLAASHCHSRGTRGDTPMRNNTGTFDCLSSSPR